MELVACPLCGSTTADHILTGPDRVHAVAGQFTVVRCRTCRFVYQNPRPSAASFAAIYPTEYGPYQSTPSTTHRLHPDLAMACSFVDRMQPQGGQLLDVGCGPGHFLKALQQTQPQWQLAGVEPDTRAAAQAQTNGLMVQNCTIETATLDNASWDAITLWNVIEHLADPVGMLQRIRTLLRPQGLLYMAVPMLDSWDARIFGKYWTGWELPRHFSAFDRASLARLLHSSGFQMVGSACINGRSYGWTASLRLLIQDRIRSYPLRRLGEALTYSRPLALAISPYTALAVARKRCTVLTIAARIAP